MEPARTDAQQALGQGRSKLLRQLEDWLEMPMLILAFAWLALLTIELLGELSPLLEVCGTVIWGLFLLDFVVKLLLAPEKVVYLKRNWLNIITLLVPALRILRIVQVIRVLRVARAARSLRLVRVVSGLNRGMRALGTSMGRRGFGYVVALTFVITLVGAAGMYAFEAHGVGEGGFDDYGTALWWTAMIITTMGSEYWPQTVEGRALCFLLSLYAFAVFGYVTAALASFFIGREAESASAELAGTPATDALRTEIAALRAEVQALALAFQNAVSQQHATAQGREDGPIRK